MSGVLGINFITDLFGHGSLSEVARITLNSIRRQGIAVSYIEALFPSFLYRDMDESFPELKNLPTGSRYPLNLLGYNLHILHTLLPDRLPELKAGKYTIGNWVWEMPQMPEQWIPHFQHVKEIWVPSSFSQKIFQAVTHKPVQVMPHPISVNPLSTAKRADFGLPENRYIFLFTFSAGSGDGRKNPWGVIKAFEKAFGAPGKAADSPLLVMKSQHSQYYPDLMAALSRAISQVNGHFIMDAYTRPQIDSLLRCIDVYVSLHRAEGFGLGMAEAMCAGKPVIATAYSGNMDYMTDKNSYLVPYHLRPVTKEDHRYRPNLLEIYKEGLLWAEPDIDRTAEYMVQLYENQAEGRQRGQKAAAHIQQHFSLDAVGEKMAERLCLLSQTHVQP